MKLLLAMMLGACMFLAMAACAIAVAFAIIYLAVAVFYYFQWSAGTMALVYVGCFIAIIGALYGANMHFRESDK